MTTPDY